MLSLVIYLFDFWLCSSSWYLTQFWALYRVFGDLFGSLHPLSGPDTRSNLVHLSSACQLDDCRETKYSLRMKRVENSLLRQNQFWANVGLHSQNCLIVMMLTSCDEISQHYRQSLSWTAPFLPINSLRNYYLPPSKYWISMWLVLCSFLAPWCITETIRRSNWQRIIPKMREVFWFNLRNTLQR